MPLTIRPSHMKVGYTQDGKPMLVRKTWEEMMEAYEKSPLTERIDFYRRTAPMECVTLDSFSELSVRLEQFHAENNANWVVLYSSQKRKNISEARRQECADIITENLQELGFDRVYNFKDQGKGSDFAAAYIDVFTEFWFFGTALFYGLVGASRPGPFPREPYSNTRT